MQPHPSAPPQPVPTDTPVLATRVTTGRGTRLDLPADGLLALEPWHDPAVDRFGLATDSDYVEWFWLPILGPTATWLVRRLARCLVETPTRTVVDLVDIAASVGVVWHPGHDGPFTRALSRCLMFGACAPVADTSPVCLAVRLNMPQLPARHIARLPASLRDMHHEWVECARQSHTGPSHANG